MQRRIATQLDATSRRRSSMDRATLLLVWLLRSMLLAGCSGLEAPPPGGGEPEGVDGSAGFAAFTGVAGRSLGGLGGSAAALGSSAGRTAAVAGGRGGAAAEFASGAVATGGSSGQIGATGGALPDAGGGASGAARAASGAAGVASGAAGVAGGSSDAGETEPDPPVRAWFGEYVEGSGAIKALEIVAAEARPLAACAVRVHANGGIAYNRSIPLSGKGSAAEPFVLCSEQVADTGAPCNLVPTNFQFNGNDAVVLVCDGAVMDVVGRVGEDPGVAWGTGEITTVNTTLRRDCSITEGDAIPDDTFDPAASWVSAGLDALDDLGQYCVPGAP